MLILEVLGVSRPTATGMFTLPTMTVEPQEIVRSERSLQPALLLPSRGREQLDIVGTMGKELPHN